METRVESGIEPASEVAEAAYPTLKESWGALGWFLLIMVLAVALVFLVFNKVLHHTSIFVSALATALGEVATIGFLLWRYRRRLPRLQLLGCVPGSVYGLLPVIVLTQVVLRSTVNYLHLPNWAAEAFLRLQAQPVLAFVLFVISAPVLEEVLFRGILLTGLLRNYRPWVAIGQSALLFGLFHLNPVQTVSAGLMGLLLGWLYYRTRSLLLTIALHALNNLLALQASTHPATSKLNGAEELFASSWYYVAAVLLSAVVLAVILRRVHQRTVPHPEVVM